MPFGGLGFDSEWHRHKSLGSRSMEPNLAMHNPGRSQHVITCRCGEIPGLKFSQGSTGHSVALQPSFLRSSRREFLGTPSSEWRAGINMWSRQGYAKLQPEALVQQVRWARGTLACSKRQGDTPFRCGTYSASQAEGGAEAFGLDQDHPLPRFTANMTDS